MPREIVDPDLAPPWRKLFDETSGAEYYWNKETGITTYDRPVAAARAPAPAPPPGSQVSSHKPMRLCIHRHSGSIWAFMRQHRQLELALRVPQFSPP